MAGQVPSPIESLLVALREAGLPVGVSEVLRVEALLRCLAVTEAGGGADLRDLLACAVVRGVEERATFDRVYSAWQEAQEGERAGGKTPAGTDLVSGDGPGQAGMHALERATPDRRTWGKRRIAVAVAVGLGIVAALGALILRGSPPTEVSGADAGADALSAATMNAPDMGETDVGDADAGDADVGDADVGDADVADAAAQKEGPTTSRAREVVFTVEPRARVRWEVLLPLLALAAALFVGLGQMLRTRDWWPRVEVKPRRKGPAEQPMLPPKKPGALLSATARDDLAFAVDRFVRDESSPELDLPRSVEATISAGGMPALVFKRALEHRLVRLWVDTGARSALVGRYAAEVQTALIAAGLPCERAHYHLVPDALESEESGALSPHDVDEAAHGSAILLVTDGLQVAKRLAHPAVMEFAVPVLRLLARWPRVAFVAVTPEGRAALGPLTARFNLLVIGPEDVEPFLEGQDRKASPWVGRRLRFGEARAWGAVCALSERPVDMSTALALRDAAGVKAAPWVWDLLLAEGEDSERLAFAGPARGRWLRWLADQSPAESRWEQTLLGAALGFWKRRYEDEDSVRRTRESEENAEPWTGTPAWRQFQAERAKLLLWREPREAATVLGRAFGKPSDAEARLLSGYAVRLRREDKVDVSEGVVLLPWLMSDLRDTGVPAVLQGFGLGVLGVTERRWTTNAPGRAFLAVGAAAGMALVGGAVGLARWAVQSAKDAARADDQMDAGQPEPAQADAGQPEPAQADAGQPEPAQADAGQPEPNGLITDSRQCGYLAEEVKGMTLVRVCGGEFMMGDDKEGLDDEKPAHRVRISTFWIGKYEVSNAQFREWRAGYQADESGVWPATSVSWDEAEGYCKSLGLRLPTEAEWEYAARGPEGRKYPWGPEPATKARAVMHQSKPEDVTARSEIGSPFGTVQQAGNAWEWVQDCYEKNTYLARSGKVAVDPVTSASSESCDPVLRGGSFKVASQRNLRSTYRYWNGPESRSSMLGFRCARGVVRPR